MKGVIFSIKRYSVHDGPGIRVTFFMKGCPLSCLWCHNPEGISPEIIQTDRKDRIGEMEFSEIEDVGKEYSVPDLITVVEKERVFIERSEGGVTFSGGEPANQIEFLLEALKALKNIGIHTAVDTSGYTPGENLLKIFPFTNLFLFDLKQMDPQNHFKFTGVSNELILENYRLVAESGKDFMVRIPVVPGYNDDHENLFRLRELILNANHDNLKKINLLPFHKIGSSKYKRFNMKYDLKEIEPPSTERMRELKAFFMETGLKVKIGG
jgi:pyruvate formate lyase activating enzyme